MLTAQSALESIAWACRQLLRPRMKRYLFLDKVQEHWRKVGFSEKWGFGHLFVNFQGFHLGQDIV
jgi:hypothetical protein